MPRSTGKVVAGWPSGIRVVPDIQLRKLFNYRRNRGGLITERDAFRGGPEPSGHRKFLGVLGGSAGRAGTLVSNFTKGRYAQGRVAHKLNCGCPLDNCSMNCTLIKSQDRD